MVCGARPLTKSALDTLLAAVCGEDEGETAEGRQTVPGAHLVTAANTPPRAAWL